jgi:toxin-antitoxin system PIN domain toxin
VFVVDTNVLLYAANQNSPGHEPCKRLLAQWRDQTEPWYLTWGIIYEFLRVSTHPRVFPKPLSLRDAWSFLEAVLAPPAAAVLQETQRHGALLQEMAAQVPGLLGNLMFDAHTAILMREHGIKRIYTRDADFRRFPFLEVIDPLQ